MKIVLLSILTLFLNNLGYSQESFTNNPFQAQFIIEDYERFWRAFDEMDNSPENPFEDYLKNASDGFKPLVGYFDAKTLYQTVQKRKEEYLKSRNILDSLSGKETEIKKAYSEMKRWYPSAKFPPIYFVVGTFTSSGTITDGGLLIGSEKLKNLNGLTGLIAHELVHYQQKIAGKDNLLKQSIMEGSADFIGEMISGEHINLVPFNYGNENEKALCKEFLKVMNKKKYKDWLYETSGKDDRPKDLGYWIGYKITEAYFQKQVDKRQAINSILNIKNPMAFLQESGYLEKYIIE